MIIEYKLENGAFAPMYAYPNDAAADLFTPESFTVYPGKQYILNTRVRFFIPAGYYASVVPKSGLAANAGIAITNSPGTIDSGYVGTVMIIILNTGRYTKDFNAGDKVAQIIFKKKEKVELKQVFIIPDTDRGENGFGSTGR